VPSQYFIAFAQNNLNLCNFLSTPFSLRFSSFSVFCHVRFTSARFAGAPAALLPTRRKRETARWVRACAFGAGASQGTDENRDDEQRHTPQPAALVAIPSFHSTGNPRHRNTLTSTSAPLHTRRYLALLGYPRAVPPRKAARSRMRGPRSNTYDDGA
jgi:hypothetical protein